MHLSLCCDVSNNGLHLIDSNIKAVPPHVFAVTALKHPIQSLWPKLMICQFGLEVPLLFLLFRQCSAPVCICSVSVLLLFIH